MIQRNLSLLIPVENQVRELDPKLLLACVAAAKGFPSVIGPRREVHFRIPSFPRSVYLSKSVTAASELVFRILRKLGHEVVAWDEEALVHLPDETYYSRRLSPTSLGFVSALFAWGEDNAEMWRRYPLFPRGVPIHVTGNPRMDLLRPEMHGFYDGEVARIREQHGDFILVNTNFNHVNAFSPVQNLFQPPGSEGEPPPFGRAAAGMTRAYAEGLRDHKQAVLEEFKNMIPALERAFPDHVIVVRPHPTENPAIYREMASRCARVRVTNEGNVVPWLLATKALVHNGCTTGVEAYVMDVPALSYRATVDERYDDGFYRLPNKLSHPCFDFESLREMLKRVFRGEGRVAGGGERKALVDHYLGGLDGPLACERIVAVLEEMVDGRPTKKIGVTDRIHGWSLSTGRTLIKRFKAYLPGSHNRPAFQRHRYPGVSTEDIRERVARFEKILKPGARIQVDSMGEQFFRISAS
jgi:surface carbohydrate biosynthesis protein